MTKEDFGRRPQCEKGDEAPGALMHNVGLALTHWETFESELAEAFDAMLHPDQQVRAGINIYLTIGGFETRRRVFDAAISSCLPDGSNRAAAVELVRLSEVALTRRNDIAHGRLYFAEGFWLAPNNVAGMRKWPKGTAAYQWNAEDILYYAKLFIRLAASADALKTAIKADAVKIGEWRDSRR